jgi:hypothetical protein
MRRAPWWAVGLLTACASTPTPTPRPTVPTPTPTPTATATTAAAPATTTASAAPATSTPKAPAVSPEAVAAAKALVDQGRVVQREKGEGGAEEAVALYRAALEKDPGCADALWELGWSYQVLDDWEKVLEAWDALRAMQPDYPELSVHYPVAVMRRDQARALAALPDAKDRPPPEETPREGPTLAFTAVGDVQLGRAWPAERAKLPPEDARPIFAEVLDRLRVGDVQFGNLETVLADDGDSSKCGPRSTKCFAFRVPTAYAKTLAEVGFDVMSIANNHTGDFGPEGREATAAALDAAGVKHSGPIGDLASWETNGLRVGLVAFSTGGGVYRIQDLEMAAKVVADLDRRHDLVIVSFHGGAEGTSAAHVPNGPEAFYGEDRGDLRKFARTVIDAGADLVVGHGPHLLRGMELYKSRLIAYSLGNFCTWETFSLKAALGITGILKVKLAANGVLLEAALDPLVIGDPGIPRPDPKRQAIDLVRTLSKEDFGDPFLDAEGRWTRPGPRS